MHRCQMAPLLKYVNVSAAAGRVMLPEPHFAWVRPHLQPIGTERKLQAQVVQLGFFLAATHALAASDLVCKAAAFPGVKPQGVQAQAVSVGQLAYAADGLVLGPVHTV